MTIGGWESGRGRLICMGHWGAEFETPDMGCERGLGLGLKLWNSDDSR